MYSLSLFCALFLSHSFILMLDFQIILAMILSFIVNVINYSYLYFKFYGVCRDFLGGALQKSQSRMHGCLY
jgi:cobalamin synthase